MAPMSGGLLPSLQRGATPHQGAEEEDAEYERTGGVAKIHLGLNGG